MKAEEAVMWIFVIGLGLFTGVLYAANRTTEAWGQSVCANTIGLCEHTTWLAVATAFAGVMVFLVRK